MSDKYLSNKSENILLVLGLVTLVTTIWAIYNNYSPVPYWDMWDSYLLFYTDYINNGWEAIWRQHNEHRIVLSKLLFLLDFRLFGGEHSVLLLVNLIIQFSNIFIIYHVARKLACKNILGFKGMLGILLVFMMSWSQKENFEWGFQSQFFVVYFFSFCTFYFFAISLENESIKPQWLLFSLLFYILATLSMSSGILVGLAILVQLLLWKRNYFLVLLVCLTIALLAIIYFYNYESTAGTESLFKSLIGEPISILKYICVYFGSVFYSISNSIVISFLFGVLFLCSSVYIILFHTIRKSYTTARSAMCGMLIFLVGAAVATAGGRYQLGLGQAISSRYITPVSFAWVVLIFSFADVLPKYYKKIYAYILLIMTISLSVAQYRAFLDESSKVIKQELAVISLFVGVNDESVIESVYPVPKRASTISRYAISNNVSVFKRFNEIKSQYETLDISNIDKCKNTVQSYSISYFTGGYKFLATIDNEISEKTVINIFDSDAKWLGFGKVLNNEEQGLLGAYFIRPNMSHNFNPIITLAKGNSDSCLLMDKLSLPAYSIYSQRIDGSFLSEIALSNIVPSSGWKKNGVFSNFNREEGNVYGSYIGGDLFTGAINIEFKEPLIKSVSFPYITGPNSRNIHIRLDFDDGTFYQEALENSNNQWKMLFIKLDGKKLEKLSIVDNGQGFGEWAAIAIN